MSSKPDPGIDERQAYALAEAYKNGREQGQRDEREAAGLRVTALRDESEVQLWSDIIAAARGEKP